MTPLAFCYTKVLYLALCHGKVENASSFSHLCETVSSSKGFMRNILFSVTERKTLNIVLLMEFPGIEQLEVRSL